MNFAPKIIETELERVQERIGKHVNNCPVCLAIRSPSKTHQVRLLAEVRQTFREHVQRCHTCRTRGEAAQLEHHRAVLREYVLKGARV